MKKFLLKSNNFIIIGLWEFFKSTITDTKNIMILFENNTKQKKDMKDTNSHVPRT